jgi:hypothetical protein
VLAFPAISTDLNERSGCIVPRPWARGGLFFCWRLPAGGLNRGVLESDRESCLSQVTLPYWCCGGLIHQTSLALRPQNG